MNRLITLHDVLNRTIVYSGWARIEPIANGKMIEFEDETYQYCWKIYEKGMTLTSKSEMDVVLTFKDQTKTKGHIDSEFGRMDVHCHTRTYDAQDDRIELKYDLIQQEQVSPFHFVLEIEQEILHEVH